MNQIGDIFIGKKYAVYAPGKKVESQTNNQVNFVGGSFANLQTGICFDLEPDSKMVAVEIKDGENIFEFGNLNNNPKSITGHCSEIQIEYPGIVEFLVSPDDETHMTENSYCYGKVTNGQLHVYSASYTKLTYYSRGSTQISISGVSTGADEKPTYPILQIFAPKNIRVSGGKVKALFFTEIDSVEKLNTHVLSGNHVRKVDLACDGKTVIDCPVVTESFSLKTQGKVFFANQIQCPKIDIKTNSKVRFLKPVWANRVEITTNGKVEITTIFAIDLIIETNSKVNVLSGYLKNATISKNGQVTFLVSECEKIDIKSNDKVDVIVKDGHTKLTVNTNGEVCVSLETAKEIVINTNSKVEVTASTYLAEPKVKTQGKYHKNNR